MNRAFVLLRVSGGFKVNTLFVGVLVLFLSFVLLLFQQNNSGKRILPKKGCHCLPCFVCLFVSLHSISLSSKTNTGVFARTTVSVKVFL